MLTFYKFSAWSVRFNKKKIHFLNESFKDFFSESDSIIK